jgi:cellulose 1,4-beta-cellobiosidase
MTSAIRHPRRVTALLGAGALIATGLVVPATAAHAAVACDVTYQATHWTERPGAGGFQANLTITNLGEPVDGWTLSFTLPAGQTFRHGWGGLYTILPPDGVSIGNQPWNARLGTGQSTGVGFLGTWSGTFTVPTTFHLNGVLCDGAEPPENQPPTVTLTSPPPSTTVLIGRPLTLAAEAADPDGAVDRVEFLVDGAVVATDDTAPYEVSWPVTVGLGPHSMAARAVDDGTPPLATVSAPVSFNVISLPPLGSIIEPAALEVTEGGTATVDVRLDVSAASQDITMTVTGAPGVTVSPATFSLGPDNVVQEVTVTAAADAGGQVATLAATGPSLTSTGRTTVTVRDVIVDERVANPYAGPTGRAGATRSAPGSASARAPTRHRASTPTPGSPRRGSPTEWPV